MKNFLVSLVLLLALATSVSAQELKVPEPEFVNSYCILTSDSTYAILPKESGTIGKHQNKVSKWSKVLGNVAQFAGAAGVVGMATSGSASGVINGARTVGTAMGVSNAVDAVSGLAGSVGMDIIFKGGKSAYQLKHDGGDIRLLIKAESNENDPMEIYRVVRFEKSKKERRIQWMEIQPSLLGSSDAVKAGFVNFTGHKYGNQSYLLTIPASEMEPGEYGVFFMSIATATTIPVGTFSVK